MASVRMVGLFLPGTVVELVERRSHALHVEGEAVASGTVGEDASLEIENVPAGSYWARAKADDDADDDERDDIPKHPIAVTAKDGPEPKPAQGVPEGDRSFTVGARTTGNTRVP